MPATAKEVARGKNGAHGDRRRQVLVWLAPEFLQSAGTLRILHESELLPVAENKWPEFIRAAVESGGFALEGRLADANHGAGIWISPESSQGLELMIPWAYVRSVATAPEQENRKMFGLARNGAWTGSNARGPVG